MLILSQLVIFEEKARIVVLHVPIDRLTQKLGILTCLCIAFLKEVQYLN